MRYDWMFIGKVRQRIFLWRTLYAASFLTGETLSGVYLKDLVSEVVRMDSQVPIVNKVDNEFTKFIMRGINMGYL